MGPQGAGAVSRAAVPFFSRAGLDQVVRPQDKEAQPGVLGVDTGLGSNHLTPVVAPGSREVSEVNGNNRLAPAEEEEPLPGGRGLSQSGEPEEPEVEVVE